jgi:CheY-like chemotaxis protein
MADFESPIELSNVLSAQRSFRIIVAEDDPTLLKLYPILFKNLTGFKFGRSFVNGRELVDYFLRKPNSSSETEECEIVLMDYKMPIMNGADAAKVIRKVNPNVKIVCVSGLDIPNEDQKWFDRTIRKPFSAKDLVETLRSLLVSEEIS